MVEVREYLTEDGNSPFRKWFSRVNPVAAAKITMALARIEADNPGDAKSVGGGVHELRITHGPGYRVYFGRDGNTLVIVLGGGTKKRQSNDIKQAQGLWADYKKRKRR